MKLLVSAVLLAAASAALGQADPQSAQTVPQPIAPKVLVLQAMSTKPRGYCPVFLTAASVSSPGRVLPVANARPFGNGVLNLHFQYESHQPISSVSITAHLRVKTNVYALDARPLDVQLTFGGTGELDRDVDHLTQIALPTNIYLFGVARVSVNSVTFNDGAIWTPDSADRCGTGGNGMDRIAK